MSGRRSSNVEGGPRGFGRLALFGQNLTSWDGARILSEEDAQEIFLLLDLLFQSRDFCARGKNQLFRLAHVQQRGRAAIRKNLRQPQRFLPRIECAF